MEKVMQKVREAGEDETLIKTLSEELNQYETIIIGVGNERKYNRKTIIFEKNGKWIHRYGKTYVKCIKKQVRKERKKEKGDEFNGK